MQQLAAVRRLRANEELMRRVSGSILSNTEGLGVRGYDRVWAASINPGIAVCNSKAAV